MSGGPIADLNVRVPLAFKRRLKHLATDRDQSMNALVLEALRAAYGHENEAEQ